MKINTSATYQFNFYAELKNKVEFLMFSSAKILISFHFFNLSEKKFNRNQKLSISVFVGPSAIVPRRLFGNFRVWPELNIGPRYICRFPGPVK